MTAPPTPPGWTIAADTDGRWAVAERGFTYDAFGTEPEAVAWLAGFMVGQGTARA